MGMDLEERRWFTCNDPRVLLRFLANRRASERKLRLFACALGRRLWHVLSPEGRAAIEVAERYADGLAGEQERRDALEAAGGSFAVVHTQADCIPAKALVDHDLDYYVDDASCSVFSIPDESGRYLSEVPFERQAGEKSHQCAILRDLFGNPFRPIALDPVWHEGIDRSVLKLARTIHDDREFTDLPLLAAALEASGCKDRALMGHCRKARLTHVRGCWALDALLGRA